MSGHTPGPWRIDPKFWRDIQSEDGLEICTVDADGCSASHFASPPQKEAEANSRMIAAAPDLLAALEAAFKALDAIGDEMTVGERYANARQYLIDSLPLARAAIAKARGAS